MKPEGQGFNPRREITVHEVTRLSADDRMYLALAYGLRVVGTAGALLLLAMALRVMGWVRWMTPRLLPATPDLGNRQT